MHAVLGDFCVFLSSNVLMSCYKPKPSSDIMLENVQAYVCSFVVGSKFFLRHFQKTLVKMFVVINCIGPSSV